MDYLIFKICLICACTAFVWVEILTTTRGILGWIPAYYPIKLREKPLMCSDCLSGWLAILTSFCIFTYTWGFMCPLVYGYITFSPCLAMCIVRMIKR